MTDSHDPNQLDPLDDLASAHLDGQTTPVEDASAAADPAIAARVGAMAAVRAALRAEGPPVDEARREASIAAALAAFDDEAATPSSATAASGVTPIAVAAARRRVSRRSLQVVGAVAVAVLLAIAVPLLGVFDSDPDSPSEVATSALDEASGTESAERDGGDAAAGTGSAQPPAADSAFSAPLIASVDLGTFEDLAALEEAAGAYVAPLPAGAEDAATPTTTTARVLESAAGCAGSPGAGIEVLTGTATLEGRPVLVFVYEGEAGDRTVVVVDPADCSIISSRELD